MSSFVVSEMSLGGEAHITVGKVTPEWLLSIVDAHVCEQVALLSEGLLTAFNLADEWSLSSL